MNLQLDGKLALVTGSTTGIGYAIAANLAAEQATVIINGRTEARVAEAVANLKAQGIRKENLRTFVGDLTNVEARVRLFATFPTLDILVNNLGIFSARNLAEITLEDWRQMFETNVVSGAELSKYYLPKMTAANAGRVLFIASEAGVNIPEDMIHYGVSKAAQMALARGLAETTKGTAVTVNAVLPGPTYSEGINGFLESLPLKAGQNRAEMEAEFLNTLRPTSLIQRFAKAEEVAAMVTFLASPLASATNGAAIRVEGGLLRHV